jgi:hypothetical protein
VPSSSAGSHVARDGRWRAGRGDIGPVGSSPPRQLRHPVGSRSTTTVPTSPSTPMPYRSSSSGSGRSGEVRCAAPARPPPVRPQDRVQCPAEGGQVPVVDAPVIQLTGELAEQPRPVSTGRLEGYTDLDPPLDHLHCRPAGVRRAALLPGPVPAGGRAPLRDRAAAARGDRSAAPSAGRRGDAAFGPVRRRAGLVGTGALHCGLLVALTALLFTGPPSCPVFVGAARSHGLKSAGSSPVTRHHEFPSPACKTCDGR